MKIHRKAAKDAKERKGRPAGNVECWIMNDE